MTKEFLAGESSLFWKKRPTLAFDWIGCTGVGDITLPEGDLSPVYCPDPADRTKFKVSRKVPGEPGLVTFSLQRPLREVNRVLSMSGDIDFLLTYALRGDRTQPDVYDVAFILLAAMVTQRSLSPVAALQPGDNARVMTNAEISADAWIELLPVTARRLTTTETMAANGIAFLPALAGVRDAGEVGYAATDADTGVTANVLKTSDGGGAWAATAADPFAADEHVGFPVLVEMPSLGTGAHRLIVARIVTDAGSPAEIAYSDDEGATWTAVNIGSTNAEYVTALYRLDDGFIVAGLDSGDLYVSRNKGLTWTAWSSGVSQQITGIDFIDRDTGYAVGAANTFILTDDGGETWTAGTGPAAATVLNKVFAVDDEDLFVVAADGSLYRSTDAGLNWTEIAFSGSGAGSALSVAFDPKNRYVGYLVHSPAAGADKLFRSYDKGVTWEEVTLPGTNTGVNAVFVADPNLVFAAGEPVGGTAYLVKVS